MEYYRMWFSSKSKLILEIVALAFPICISFIVESISTSVTYYFVRNESIHITESLSITRFYLNCFMIGFYWGGSFGFLIIASKVYGSNDIKALEVKIQNYFGLTLLFSILLSVISWFYAPLFGKLLSSNPTVIVDFTTQIKCISTVIPFYGLYVAYYRIAMTMQNSIIILKSTLLTLVVHIISLIFSSMLNFSANYVIGLSYIFNYTSSLILFILFVKSSDKCFEIKWKIKTMFSFKGMLDITKEGIYPFLNYNILLLSIELVSGLGLFINELNFTLLCILINILVLASVSSEGIASAMSTLISYANGKNAPQEILKIFEVGLLLTFILQLLYFIGMSWYFNEILSIFSLDPDFLLLASDYRLIYSTLLFLNGFLYAPSEMIVVLGNQSVPFYTIIIGKFVFQFGGCLLFKHNLNLQVILIFMILGQVICLLIFAYHIVQLIRNILLTPSSKNERMSQLKDIKELLLLNV